MLTVAARRRSASEPGGRLSAGPYPSRASAPRPGCGGALPQRARLGRPQRTDSVKEFGRWRQRVCTPSLALRQALRAAPEGPMEPATLGARGLALLPLPRCRSRRDTAVSPRAQAKRIPRHLCCASGMSPGRSDRASGRQLIRGAYPAAHRGLGIALHCPACPGGNPCPLRLASPRHSLPGPSSAEQRQAHQFPCYPGLLGLGFVDSGAPSGLGAPGRPAGPCLCTLIWGAGVRYGGWEVVRGPAGRSDGKRGARLAQLRAGPE